MSSATPSKLTDIIKPADLTCLELQEYLKTKATNVIESLYNHPSICLAVYRELPEIARQYVIRILFVEQPVPQAIITSWTSQIYAKEHAAASSTLSDLMIWRPKTIQGGLPAWELTPVFEKNLKIALLGGGRPWSMSHTLDTDKYARDISFLDNYATSRWRCVLHYMVGASGGIRDTENEHISRDAARVLLSANLMRRDETDSGTFVITRQGFQFLLLDTQAQVWHFMLQYLESCEQTGMNLAECLSMLFQISFSTLGRDYSLEGLSENLQTFLQHLREFGLVYMRKRSAGRFYPTRLALNISCKRSAVAAIAAHSENGQDRCQIIVETNYRIYAYTDSNLQVALLGLFTELLYRFPNVVVGVLTRDSIRQAFRGGITADQIISYLEQHAHPTMLTKESVDIKTNSLLPPTVIDQIKLWENERNRFVFNEGIAYNQFMSQSDFISLRDYAQSIKVLMWSSDRTRTMVVTKNGHEDVRKFWKRYQKGTSST